ncbi:23S rRNA (pseudouridine(1915)-N(3))-methyltransferase RlmH [Candidatus Gracilibacteria bacterium]|nr:23S rRNA (pseudouridine(1915)-N(3))-methyltransferase RlmH [Candidatus Gracilibacteria bacterium]
MFHIQLITVGKLKDRALQELAAEYTKRLSPYAKLQLVEIIETPFKSPQERPRIIEAEAKKIIKFIPKDSFLFVLDERGKQFSSVDFAKFIEKRVEKGSTVTFIIGGPLGVTESIKAMADSQLALSTMTFTHQMARVLLIEQLYRACAITAGKTYHY